MIVSGRIFSPDGFFEGYVEVENGKLIHVCRGSPPHAPVLKGTILPLLFNHHTHIADIIAREKVQKSRRRWTVEELVGPGGEKHRILGSAADAELILGMQTAIEEMLSKGTAGFCDFRESGIKGLELLNKALEDFPMQGDSHIDAIRLGRPAQNRYDKEEMNRILNISEGIGISSISDWDYSELQKVARHARSRRKIFAIHVSERIREDIDAVLDLDPDFVVHMIKATDSDMKKVAEAGVPVVICPKSNRFFGMRPPVKRLVRAGARIKLGTDNAMISNLNLLEEIKSLRSFNIGLVDAVKMCTGNLFNIREDSLSPGPASFMVVDREMRVKAVFRGVRYV